jgi:hypothetical protein
MAGVPIVAVNGPLEVGRAHRTYLSTELPLHITVTSTRGDLSTLETDHTPYLYSSGGQQRALV